MFEQDTVAVEDQSLAEKVTHLESLAKHALQLEGEEKENLIQQIIDQCIEEGLTNEEANELLEEIGLVQEKVAARMADQQQGDMQDQSLPGANAQDVTRPESLVPDKNVTSKVKKRPADKESPQDQSQLSNSAKEVSPFKAEEFQYNVDDDINALVEGEELSEEFVSKAKTIFEAAVTSKVNEVLTVERQNLEEQLQVALEEQVSEYKEEIVDRVDSYLNYVVEQWMEDNKLSVENGIRTEITEDFLSGLKNLFVEHYVDIPENKVDVVDELFEKVENLQDQLNQQIETGISLHEELLSLKKEKILSNITEDLSVTQAEKVLQLAEGIEEDNIELYAKKVNVIKENYFPYKEKVEQIDEQIEIVEEEESDNVLSEQMQMYTRAIAKTNR